MEDYIASITEECFTSSGKFSAIVAGKMFVDSSGGELKWDFDKIILNKCALKKVTEEELHRIFVPNWKKLHYPLLPIIFTFGINNSG